MSDKKITPTNPETLPVAKADEASSAQPVERKAAKKAAGRARLNSRKR